MSRCPESPPGTPGTHIWVLESEQSDLEEAPRTPVSVWRWIFYAIMAAIPIAGWMMIGVVEDERRGRYVSVGLRERWYCTQCREFEVRHVPWNEVIR